jgi:hypothetical protein
METIWKHKITGKGEGRPSVLQTDFLGGLPTVLGGKGFLEIF